MKIKNIVDGHGLPSALIGGAFSLTLSTIIVKILGLFYKIPLASILGDEGMGYFNSAYTVYAFFYLICTAGVPKAVMIMVSEARAKGREIEESRVVRVALVMFLSLGIFVTATFVILSGGLARLIGNSKSAATMIAIAPSIVFISLSGVIRGYLSANMKLLDIAVSQIIEGVGKLVLGLIFATVGSRLSLPLELISAFTILGVTFGSLFGLIYLWICSKIRISSKKAGQNINKQEKRMIARRMLSISIPITVSAAIMSITNIIDLGLIMRSLTEIGYSESQSSALYGNYTTLAVPMLNLAISIITPVTVAFLPKFTDCAVRMDREGLIALRKSSLELTAFISAPLTLGLLLFPVEILDLLFKNCDTRIGGALLCILAPAITFSSLLVNVNTLLESHGRVRAPLISMLFGSGAKIVVSYLLITRSGLGVFGAPVGTVVSYGIALAVSLIIYGRELKESIPIFSTGVRSYVFAFLSVGCARALFDKTGRGGASLIGSIVFAALIYLALSVLSALFKKEKSRKLAKSTNLN